MSRTLASNLEPVHWLALLVTAGAAGLVWYVETSFWHLAGLVLAMSCWATAPKIRFGSTGQGIAAGEVESSLSSEGLDSGSSELLDRTLGVVREVFHEVDASNARVHNLVREAIGNLGRSFDTLNSLSGSQRDLVVNMTAKMEFDDMNGVGDEVVSIPVFVAATQEILKEFVKQIVTISRQSMTMVVKIDDLTKQLAEIQDATRNARKLAAKTSLLALNAKIEAVHAGQQGRGFGVVADEAKALARESFEFNAQISDLVTDTQGTIKQTRDVIAEVASKDMGTAIQYMGKVDGLGKQIEQMNESMSLTVADIQATTERLNENVAVAIRSLQFEDMVTQALGYSSAIVDHTFKFVDELLEANDSTNPSARMSDEELEESIARFRECWENSIQNPVNQDDMEEGDVELF